MAIRILKPALNSGLPTISRPHLSLRRDESEIHCDALSVQAFSTPEAFAICVAIASIREGERQS